VKPAEPLVNGCSSGPGSPQSAPQSSLPEALAELARAIDRQNDLIGQIVAQNADLLAMLSEREPGEEESSQFDLAGRPLR
jgi:hypothetical protein